MKSQTDNQVTPEVRTERGAPVRCMEWLSRIVCKWKGHDEVNDLQAWECTRCRMVMDYDEAVKTPWRDRLRGWLKSKKDWLKCPDCGLRFGKHDDSDHIPF